MPQNSAATPNAPPSAPNAVGSTVCVPLTSITRRPLASPRRFAGACRARIDSVIGCDTPSPSPSTNDSAISDSSDENAG